MIRTFCTHKIRPQQELTNKLWDFTPCQGEFCGKHYSVATPSCWESYPDFTGYRGEGIYTTQFEAEGTIRLEMKGISHTATVYLDEREIAHHYNAYTKFDVIVPDLASGQHVLKIKADNRFSEESALHIPNDYMTYGGINRPVVLESLKRAYIDRVQVTPFFKEEQWHIAVNVYLKNISKTPITLAATIMAADQNFSWGNTLIPPASELCLSASLPFTNVESWIPDSPKLYEIIATLSQNGIPYDDLIDRFGFREIHTSGKEILLNGKPLRIKGICRHEDHPQFCCALPYSAIAADLALIKDLGANSVRTAHYPNDEIFLDLCDELGILVWEENHARGLSLDDMQNPNFEPQAEQVIREMIPAHYNHPSIYIWGILNECASDTEYGKACYEKQFNLIRELDSSRPTSFASCKFKTDLCFGLPDVVSYNIYPLWYHDTPVSDYIDDLYQWIQSETKGAGKPFLITEIGAGGLYGYRNPYHGKWTEEYQAEALEKQITAVLNYPACCGIYIWQFCDIRISEEWFHIRPRSMNNKGIVDEYRRRKLSYNVVKHLFETLS
ncbi:beta-galactosidase [Lachnospiraceae bacterium KM106-2]|nr:beta-galactosidase [Lachnospiraceae bacterium KM106-2]